MKMVTRNDDPPQENDSMSPQSEEVWGFMEEAGCEESLIETVTKIIDQLAWAANRDCPACESRMLEEAYLPVPHDSSEANKLREAISDAGFSVMQTSGRWSIHDVSKLAEVEQAKTNEIIGQNIDLEIKVKKLEATIKEAFELFKTADAERLDGVYKARDEAEKWKSEGDMYGWNFHQGKAGGMTEASIIFYRVFRRLKADAKQQS